MYSVQCGSNNTSGHSSLQRGSHTLFKDKVYSVDPIKQVYGQLYSVDPIKLVHG